MPLLFAIRLTLACRTRMNLPKQVILLICVYDFRGSLYRSEISKKMHVTLFLIQQSPSSFPRLQDYTQKVVARIIQEDLTGFLAVFIVIFLPFCCACFYHYVTVLINTINLGTSEFFRSLHISFPLN